MKTLIILEDEKKEILSLYNIIEQSQTTNNRSLNQDIVTNLIEAYENEGDLFQGFFINDPNKFYYKFTNKSESGVLRFSVFKPKYSTTRLGISIIGLGVVFVDTNTRTGSVEYFAPPNVSSGDITQQAIPNSLNITQLTDYVITYSENEKNLKDVLNKISQRQDEILRTLNSPNINPNLKSFYTSLIDNL